MGVASDVSEKILHKISDPLALKIRMPRFCNSPWAWGTGCMFPLFFLFIHSLVTYLTHTLLMSYPTYITLPCSCLTRVLYAFLKPSQLTPLPLLTENHSHHDKATTAPQVVILVINSYPYFARVKKLSQHSLTTSVNFQGQRFSSNILKHDY